MRFNIGNKINYTVSILNKGGEWVQVQISATITESNEKNFTTSEGHKFNQIKN